MGASKTLIIVGVLLLLHGGDAKIITATSSQELQSAFDSAAAGDTIQMISMTYTGDFVISSNGPCTLAGVRDSKIESQVIGIHLTGSQWHLKGFIVKGAQQGILIEGTENKLEGIVIENCGKGMVVKSENNIIKGIVITTVQVGMEIKGSRNNLDGNVIHGRNPSIVISPESCCGYLNGIVSNGKIEFDGNNYRSEGTVANRGLHVKGCNNAFKGTVAIGHSFPPCGIINNGGNIWL